MPDTPSTPGPSPAEGRPPAMDINQQRARAELYLLDVCGLPSHLLPSGAAAGPVQVMARELRSMAMRRFRLVDKLRNAAANVSSQAVLLIEVTGRGEAPPVSPDPDPLNLRDLAAVTEWTGRLRELEHQISKFVPAVIQADAEARTPQPPPPAQPHE